MVHAGYFDSCKALKTRTCVAREKKLKQLIMNMGTRSVRGKGKIS